MDSLRYWVQRFHVDGFRFDLGATLGREDHGFDPDRGFFDAMRQDPVLARREADRRALGHRPRRLPARQLSARLAEWNDRFRDSVRALLARRCRPRAPDLRRAPGRLGRPVRHARRRPWASSTSSPRTTASPWPTSSATTASTTRPTARTTATATTTTAAATAASKGPTDDAGILPRAARCSARCSPRCSLAQGTPMLLAGDEFGRTPARQQQRLLPGQRDHLARLEAGRERRGPGAHRLRSPADCASPPPRGAARAALPARPGRAGARHPRHRLVRRLGRTGQQRTPGTIRRRGCLCCAVPAATATVSCRS